VIFRLEKKDSLPAGGPSKRDPGRDCRGWLITLSTQPQVPRCLAQHGVDQVEVGLPAVSLVVLPAALDPVAVLADPCGEALVEGLDIVSEFPLAPADAHLVDAAEFRSSV
jgi:hypothetical protein